MNRILFFFVCLCLANILSAQLVTFESLPLTTSSYWRGDSGTSMTTTFINGGAQFINRHDTSSFGDYWSGWAYSKLQDTISVSYTTNDCASIANGGNNGSSQYGVAYYNSFQPELNSIKTINVGNSVQKMYLTNTTIAYRSMQNGDGFAKKFGGITGNDPDYFRINFTYWLNNLVVGSSTFYLADFRDSNNNNDYIVKDWTPMTIGLATDSISYTMESSDTNSFGMKTPAYFCMDDLDQGSEGVTQNELPLEFDAYPNPIINELYFTNRGTKNYTVNVIAMNGATVGKSMVQDHSRIVMNTSQLIPGIYFLHISDGHSKWSYKVMKP